MESEMSDRRVEELSAHSRPGAAVSSSVEDVSGLATPDLIREIGGQMMELAQKEMELAKAEAKADIQAEISSAKRVGAAGLCGVLALNMVLVAIVFAAAPAVPGWVTAIVLAIVLAIAAVVLGKSGWTNRVESLLDTTRQTLREDVQWAKRRFRRV